MTDAIEAGARATITEDVVDIAHAEYHKVLGDKNRSGPMRAALEAAIASGALVPASAVAEMRERCRKAVRKAVLNLSPNERAVGDICDHAITDAIRQLDIAPASGDYVVVPKTALDWILGEGPDANGEWFGSRTNGVKPMKYWWRPMFRSMLHAASSNGGEK